MSSCQPEREREESSSFCWIYWLLAGVLVCWDYCHYLYSSQPAVPAYFMYQTAEFSVRVSVRVYSLWKILLRIQVTIIIHAKQIKLPNRPLWAITYIDSDWRIKHSQRFLVPSNACLALSCQAWKYPIILPSWVHLSGGEIRLHTTPCPSYVQFEHRLISV